MSSNGTSQTTTRNIAKVHGREPSGVRPRVRVGASGPRPRGRRAIAGQVAQEEEASANTIRYVTRPTAAAIPLLSGPRAPARAAAGPHGRLTAMPSSSAIVRNCCSSSFERGVGESLGRGERGRPRVDVEDRRRRPRLDLEAIRPVLNEDLGRTLLARRLREHGGHEGGGPGVRGDLVGRHAHLARDVLDRRGARHDPAEQLTPLDQRANGIARLLHHRGGRRVDENVHRHCRDRLDRAVARTPPRPVPRRC